MNELWITEQIGYIPASDVPLSADVGIVRTPSGVWLFDVGAREDVRFDAANVERIVLSHFHPDHVSALSGYPEVPVLGSRETVKHTRRGEIVTGDLFFDDLHVFPLPSSHAKGCLGLEIAGEYAFVGDGLYCRRADGRLCWNVSLLHDQIALLKRLSADKLLLSHRPGMIRQKQDVLAELEAVYARRTKNEPEIRL